MAVTIRSSSRGLPEPDINVTPLVDVVLVLLIIFMVIAPELEQGARVELPAATTAEDAKSADPITVSLTADGRTFLEKAPVDDATLAASLAPLRAADASRKVLVKGDSGAHYERMRGLFKTLQAAGFTNVALVVGTRDDRGGRAEARPDDGNRGAAGPAGAAGGGG